MLRKTPGFTADRAPDPRDRHRRQYRGLHRRQRAAPEAAAVSAARPARIVTTVVQRPEAATSDVGRRQDVPRASRQCDDDRRRGVVGRIRAAASISSPTARPPTSSSARVSAGYFSVLGVAAADGPRVHGRRGSPGRPAGRDPQQWSLAARVQRRRPTFSARRSRCEASPTPSSASCRRASRPGRRRTSGRRCAPRRRGRRRRHELRSRRADQPGVDWAQAQAEVNRLDRPGSDEELREADDKDEIASTARSCRSSRANDGPAPAAADAVGRGRGGAADRLRQHRGAAAGAVVHARAEIATRMALGSGRRRRAATAGGERGPGRRRRRCSACWSATPCSRRLKALEPRRLPRRLSDRARRARVWRSRWSWRWSRACCSDWCRRCRPAASTYRRRSPSRVRAHARGARRGAARWSSAKSHSASSCWSPRGCCSAVRPPARAGSGVRSDHVTTAQVSLQDARYQDAGSINRLFEASLARHPPAARCRSRRRSRLGLPYGALLNMGFGRVEGPPRRSRRHDESQLRDARLFRGHPPSDPNGRGVTDADRDRFSAGRRREPAIRRHLL